MSKIIENRLKKLENSQRKMNYRPMPLSWFYGEPLPPDFHTNEKYIFDPKKTLSDLYAGFRNGDHAT